MQINFYPKISLPEIDTMKTTLIEQGSSKYIHSGHSPEAKLPAIRNCLTVVLF
jgi:hypothetical protein